MKLYLDTTNEDFYLQILKEDKPIYIKHLPNYAKKVNLIPNYINEAMQLNNFELKEITDFYLNIGPGFFTGVRIGLVFIRTIALITKAKVHTISTFEILKKQYPNKENFKLEAAGKKIYLYKNKNQTFNPKEIIVELGEKEDKINFEDLNSNFIKYIPLFKKWNNILDIEPIYIKLPQIGGKK